MYSADRTMYKCCYFWLWNCELILFISDDALMPQCESMRTVSKSKRIFSFALLCSLHLLALISFYMDWNAKNTHIHARRHHNYVFIKLTSSMSKSKLLLYVHIKHSTYTAFRYLLMIITCVMDICAHFACMCAPLKTFSKE